jgi:hypothetical protein
VASMENSSQASPPRDVKETFSPPSLYVELSLVGRAHANILARRTGWGLLLGLILSFTVTRFLKSLLFQVSALDPVTYISVSLLLLLVALLACYLPARRATAVDPLIALHYE